MAGVHDVVGLTVVPHETVRDRTNRPFDTSVLRPASRELEPLPSREADATSLQFYEKWTTTFLREDAGMPAAASVYCEEARVRKWDILRKLHKVIQSKASYRAVSIENALWQSSGPDGSVSCQVFVSALVGAFRFDRKLRMEGRLARLYRCYEGAEANRADYRETVACLRLLADYKEIQKRSRELFLRYYDLWALTDDPTQATFGQTSRRSSKRKSKRDASVSVSQGGSPAISLAGVLKLIGIAGESDEDMQRTRGAFLRALETVAPHHGLKPTSSVLPYAVVMEALEYDPAILKAFQETLWNRVRDDMRMDYLAAEEEASAKRYGYIDNKILIQKALKQFSQSLLLKTWRQWFRYYEYYHSMNMKRLYVMYKRTRRMVHHWHHWSASNQERRRKNRIAMVMGRINVQRRRFSRWKRFLHNRLRIAFACRRHTELWRKLSGGFATLRFAWKMGCQRFTMHHWFEYTVFMANWEYAVKLDAVRMLKAHTHAWHTYTAMRQAQYRRDATARAQHTMIREMNESIQKEVEEFKQQEEERVQREEEEERMRRLKEKEQQAYWRKHRKQAQKRMDTKYILQNQLDERRKTSALKRQRMKEEFEAKWAQKETELAVEARKQRETWLADKEISKQKVEKTLRDLKKQFYDAPSPETAEREKQLKSLANVVLINIESELFKQGKLLNDWLLTFDIDGDGYLSHEEFKDIFRSLKGLRLSSEQIRAVIQTLDEDDDGMITIEEMETQSALVEKYCGQFGSPWKTYVDPAQDLLCYHNIQTDEKLYDYQMNNRRFKEINRANLLAEAEYESRSACHKLRDEDWIATMQNYSASVMQNMYYQWKAKRNMDKIRWKYKKMMKDKEKGIQMEAARLLQARWRGLSTRRYLRPWIAKCFYKKLNPETREKYYGNVYTNEIYDHRPHMHRRYFPNIDW